MGKRETVAGRKARHERNKEKQKNNRRSAVSPGAIMQRNAALRRKEARIKAFAERQAKFLSDFSEEMGYRFAGLQVASEEVKDAFSEGLRKAVIDAGAPWVDRENTAETREAIVKATEERVVAYNQACIDQGILVPRNLLLFEVPKARILADGTVQAAGPLDPDIRPIVEEMQRLREEATG